jgi:crotonobetainyl-CoA:carnitine CoA-transferase CaiB-like acyl-CoA transferase
MRTGIVSVADQSRAILTFGGLLAALYHAQNTGVGQKVETSLVGGVVRLMSWTMTATIWRNANPITGARINGAASAPASRRRSTTRKASRWCFSRGTGIGGRARASMLVIFHESKSTTLA